MIEIYVRGGGTSRVVIISKSNPINLKCFPNLVFSAHSLKSSTFFLNASYFFLKRKNRTSNEIEVKTSRTDVTLFSSIRDET